MALARRQYGHDGRRHSGTLQDDITTQLLLVWVDRLDIERHRQPTLRGFLPDPSQFRDMDTAAERVAQATISGETVTIYGDYDVDGATSAALLIRLMRMLTRRRGITSPTACSKGTGRAERPWSSWARVVPA